MGLSLLAFDELSGEFLHAREIPLAATQLRDVLDAEYAPGQHQGRHAGLAQLAGDIFRVFRFLHEQHDAFALRGIGNSRDGEFLAVKNLRFADAEFDCGKRDHFSSEFREAAVSPKNLHESFFGNDALIAGLVPAPAFGNKDNVVCLFLILQVTLHHLRAGDGEHAFGALRQELVCLGVNDGGYGTGRRHPDGIGVAALFHGEEVIEQHVGRVYRRERGKFRAAVAFVNVLAELELERLAHFGAQLFGTRDDIAERIETHRVYPAVYRNRAQERGGAHEDGRLVLGAHAGECLDVGRVRAEHHGHAVKEGQDKREREPERMEKREQCRHHVGTAELDDVIALERVRDYVLVREFYALGRTFRA